MPRPPRCRRICGAPQVDTFCPNGCKDAEPILQYSNEIRSAVLLVHGEKAHSRYFSETAYSKLTGGNKELLIIPGASHTDLYDQMDIIPFEKLKAFFEEYLK